MGFAPEQEQGEFNQATAYQYRLHMLFMFLDDATIKRDYENQYRLLTTLYKELYPMMNDNERKQHKKLRQDSLQAYNDMFKPKRNKNNKRNIRDTLDEWEITLRDLTQRKNMLMPQKKDSRLNI